jgi:hypothetical protein
MYLFLESTLEKLLMLIEVFFILAFANWDSLSFEFEVRFARDYQRLFLISTSENVGGIFTKVEVFPAIKVLLIGSLSL